MTGTTANRTATVLTMQAFWNDSEQSLFLFEREVESRNTPQLFVGHTTLVSSADVERFQEAAAAVNAAQRADGYEGADEPIVLDFSPAGPGDLPDFGGDSPQSTGAIVDFVEHVSGGIFHFGWYDDQGTWVEDHDAIDPNTPAEYAPQGEDGPVRRRDTVWCLSGPVNSQGRYDTDLGPAWETEDVDAEHYRQAAVAALSHLIAQGITREGNA